MTMIKIKMNTQNAAFDDGDHGHYEISRILFAIAGDIDNGIKRSSYNDTNGHPVCTVEYTGKDRC